MPKGQLSGPSPEDAGMAPLPSPAHARDFLTVYEAAAELRCSPATIRRRIRSGDLAAVRIGEGRSIRISRASQAALLEPVEPVA